MSFSDTGVNQTIVIFFTLWDSCNIRCAAACLLHKYDFKNLNFSRFWQWYFYLNETSGKIAHTYFCAAMSSEIDKWYFMSGSKSF